MKKLLSITVILLVTLAGCSTSPTASPLPPTPLPPTPTRSIQMLPTWTPSPTPPPMPSPTPRPSATALPGVVPTSVVTVAVASTALLLDRPIASSLPRPTHLVTLKYDPATWLLNTFYPTSYMGYLLTLRSDFNCQLEPSAGGSTENLQVETYTHTLGTTSYAISRVSQLDVLHFADYCTGEAEDATCYQVTPGSDHAACTQAAEAVLATYKLIPNPFFEAADKAPNRWVCQDASGTVGLCLVSYSVPLNALAIPADGQAWAAGDDGLIFHQVGQKWTQVTSPTSHPIYDLSFSSPTDGWAVGDGAQVLRWEGNAWTEELPYHAPGEGPGGSTQVLYAVDAVSAKDAWMVGAITSPDGKNRPYVLHWDGTDLLEMMDFPDCNCGLNAVLSLGKQDVLAAGGSDLGAMTFHWDGTTWTGMQVPGSDQLYTLSRGADGTVWTAGIEKARDQSDTRGSLYRWDGATWVRLAVPPVTGGVYALAPLSTGQVVLGGDFSALYTGTSWEPIATDISAFGWIVDIAIDPQGIAWALTRSGNVFRLAINP